MVEVSLLAPWMLLMFAAIFDFGMYSRALIMVENAARAAVLETSMSVDAADDSYLACRVVRSQLKTTANAGKLSSCDAAPLVVSVASGVDSEGFATSRVSVAYNTPPMFALPFMPGKMTLTRTAEMRVKP